MPKISLEDIPARRLCREPQLVEQLVEVPTILYVLKKKVDIPVPGVGGRHADLQGFPPRQSSTASQFSEERISKRIVEHNVDIPGGGLQGLRPVQGSTASRTFSPPNKSAKVTGHSSARVPRSVSSSELSAHPMARAARPQDFSDDGNIFRDHEEKIWIRLDTGQWKLLCTDTVVDQPWSQWKCLRFSSSAMAWWGIAGLGAWFGSGYMVCVSSLGAFGWFSS